MKTENLMSSRAPKPVGAYPHAKKAGNLLFLSGIGPRKPSSSEIPSDFAEQCRSVFTNLKCILEDCGSGWDQIVDVQVFLTNMEKDFKTFNALYAEYFASNQPARTTLEINRPPTPIPIELKVVATLS